MFQDRILSTGLQGRKRRVYLLRVEGRHGMITIKNVFLLANDDAQHVLLDFNELFEVQNSFAHTNYHQIFKSTLVAKL